MQLCRAPGLHLHMLSSSYSLMVDDPYPSLKDFWKAPYPRPYSELKQPIVTHVTSSEVQNKGPAMKWSTVASFWMLPSTLYSLLFALCYKTPCAGTASIPIYYCHVSQQAVNVLHCKTPCPGSASIPINYRHVLQQAENVTSSLGCSFSQAGVEKAQDTIDRAERGGHAPAVDQAHQHVEQLQRLAEGGKPSEKRESLADEVFYPFTKEHTDPSHAKELAK